jgi:ELWxxDGT repeat protein
MELWKSDGTEAGTKMVKDINPGVDNSRPADFEALADKLLFVADDGVHGKEIWISDGTEAGTKMVKDIHPTGSAQPAGLARCGDVVFFVANDGVHAYELWKTDGTEAGTVMVKDITPGGTLAWPYYYQVGLTDVNGTLFFSQYGGTSQYDWDLWKSDGTEAGTVLVKDFYWNQLALFPINGTLFLSAGVSRYGGELWKSDGTTEGTVMVKDINPAYGDGSNPSQLTNVNGTLFFVADDGTHGSELWRSDGSEAGTIMVKDIHSGGDSFNYYCENPPCMAAVADTLYFTADDGVHGSELWKSDGTITGTLLVRDINTSGNTLPGRITVAGELAFFAYGTTGAGALWVSDGSQDGTTFIQLYTDVPALLTVMGDWLYFVGKDTTHGKELWGVQWNKPSLDVKINLPLVIRQ